MSKSHRKKRIGIVGGTFNPIHLGHLRSAEEVRVGFRLDRVIFIPSATPPHKDSSHIIDARHRYKIVERAISKNPFFSASDVEIRRAGKSFTVDTLRYFGKKWGEDQNLFFILGIDAFLEIDTWKEFPELFSLSNFVVTDRPDASSTNPPFSIPKPLEGLLTKERDDVFFHPSGHRVYYFNISALDISSTKIRALLKNGGSIKYLVPDSVNKYIRRKGLYR